jgi:hypothetical protein
MTEKTELTSGPRADTNQGIHSVTIPERLRSSTRISIQPIVSPELVSTTSHPGQGEPTPPLHSS